MLITLTLIALGIVFILFLVRTSPWKIKVGSLEHLEQQLLPVSIPALTNLLDEHNLAFLNRTLPASEIRKTRNLRNRALRAYVRRIAFNARLLIAAAEVAQRSEGREMSPSRNALLESAIRTRARAVRALAELYIADFFPGALTNVPAAIQSYEVVSAQLSSIYPDRSAS